MKKKTEKMAQQQGIATLLEAEKEAAKIVAKARQCNSLFLKKSLKTELDRVQRLKDAKTEATKEIEALKQEKQAQFIQSEKQFSGSTDSSTVQLNLETDKKLVEIEKVYKANKDKVIEKLLSTIVTCEPLPHVNATKAS